MAQKKHKRERWGSQLGVILAVAGSAVGLGNFLRFPGQVVMNGGGAFMIPYLISLLIVAIPLSMSEWALGRFAGRHGYHSQMGIFYLAGGRRRAWGIAGGLMALVPFVVSMYYVFIESWCLLYALQYLGGTLEPIGLGFSFFEGVDPGLNFETTAEYGAFFDAMVGKSADGTLFNLMNSPLLMTTFFCVLGNQLLISRGISGGVEKICKLAAPLILICSLFIIVRVLTLGNPTGLPGRGILDGLGFMWNPSRDVYDAAGAVVGHTTLWQSLKNPEVWLAATAQIFFTISLCWCSITTYASYLRKKDDIALSSLTATAANEFCEVVLGGLMTIPPALMFLGANAREGFTSSFAMGFTVLANVFGKTPCGQFFGFAFYLLLFTAAITTSVSLIQPTVALFQEAFKWEKGPSVLLVGAVNLIGTLFICWFSKNLVALDVFDFWISGVFMFVFALLQTGLVAFVWGSPAFREEIGYGSRIRAPKFLASVVKFVSFPYLAIVVVFWMTKNLGAHIQEFKENPVTRYAFVFFAILAFGLLVLSWIVTARWKRVEAQVQKDGGETNALDEAAENK